jgi:hypothetical protein
MGCLGVEYVSDDNRSSNSSNPGATDGLKIFSSKFNSSSKQATVSMPSVKHEMLHRLLDEAVLMDSLSLGLEEEFVSHHSRKLTLKETSCGVWRATRKPNSFRGQHPLILTFPTLKKVIEARVVDHKNTESYIAY